MKVAGVIAEYNPFHLGHQYHLQKAKEMTGAEAVICVISGNFVQRGEPAIVDKWVRTEMALQGGADLVLELPAIFAVSSAPNFSFGAVNILNSTGIVDYLCFGSEKGETSPLYTIAEILENEPPEMSKLIKQSLSSGNSYPRARAEAFNIFFKQSGYSILDYSEYLRQPNNLLGINYIRSLIKLKSPIQPIAIQRIGSNYHETSFQNGFASATGIRKEIFTHKHFSNSYFEKAIPPSTLNLLSRQFEEGKGPVKLENFASLILGLLRRTPKERLALLPDVTEGFEVRLKNAANNCVNLEQLLTELKTKRYTWVRIQRMLIHLLLGIEKYHYQLNYQPYLRILGLNRRGKVLLNRIKSESQVPLITSVANQIKAWEKQKNDVFLQNSLTLLQKDILATDLYMLGLPGEQHKKARADFYNKVVIIE